MYYHQDQLMNDRGILIDHYFVQQAIQCDQMSREQHLNEAEKLTHLENPNSSTQLKQWLNEQGLEIDSLVKKQVAEAINQTTGDVKRVLELRQALSKSSVKKYEAM